MFFLLHQLICVVFLFWNKKIPSFTFIFFIILIVNSCTRMVVICITLPCDRKPRICFVFFLILVYFSLYFWIDFMAQEQILTYKQIFIILLRSSSFFLLFVPIFTCVEKCLLSTACAPVETVVVACFVCNERMHFRWNAWNLLSTACLWRGIWWIRRIRQVNEMNDCSGAKVKKGTGKNKNGDVQAAKCIRCVW